MAAVELVTAERAPLLARPYYERGDPGPIAAALANVPELMEVALPFIDTVYGPTSLPPRMKEIVILAVSAARFPDVLVYPEDGEAWVVTRNPDFPPPASGDTGIVRRFSLPPER